MIMRTIRAVLLLSLLGAGAHAQSPAPRCQAAVSPAEVKPSTLDPTRLIGRYTLTVVSTWALRRDTIATGAMTLWLDSTPPPVRPPSTRPLILGAEYPRPSLVGTTAAPVKLLQIWTSIDPMSRKPGGPAIRLVDSTLWFGACPEGSECEPWFRTGFVITASDSLGFRGWWEPTRHSLVEPIGAGWFGMPRGYFCAVRVP